MIGTAQRKKRDSRRQGGGGEHEDHHGSQGAFRVRPQPPTRAGAHATHACGHAQQPPRRFLERQERRQWSAHGRHRLASRNIIEHGHGSRITTARARDGGGGGAAADMPWQLAQDSMASSAPVPVCHYLGEGRKRRPAGLSAAGGNMQGIDRGIVRGSPGASRASGKKMDGGGAQQASQEAGVRGVLLPVLCAVAGPGPSPSRVYQRMTPRRAGAGTPAAVRRRRPSTPG